MQYPKFVELTDIHKHLVDSVTSKFPPYCDFQFSNLISWSSHKHPTMISNLRDNIVIEMKEYSTDRIITMFLGVNNLASSLTDLLRDKNRIERVPEEVVHMLGDDKHLFVIEPDKHNHDYLLKLSNILELQGNKMKSKRRQINAFMRLYPSCSVEVVDPIYDVLMPRFVAFFMELAKEQGLAYEKLADELEAIDKLLRRSSQFNLLILLVYHGNTLIGFTINEVLDKTHALGCFGKGLRKYKGIFAYLEYVTASHLVGSNISYINLEEDMGDNGLKDSKRLWRPEKMLKKYTFQLNSCKSVSVC